MSKKIETTERFRITCEVDTGQVGAVLAELTRRHITKVGYEVVTDVLRYKRNGGTEGAAKAKPEKKRKTAKKALGETVVAKLGRWAAKRPTFTTAEAIKYTRSLKLHDSACWSGLRHLVDGKFIRKTGVGQYALMGHGRKTESVHG